MDSNKMVKIASVVMLFTIVAASLVSGTYAKYISTASGTDSVVVAHWDIKAGAKDGEVSIYNADGSAKSITFDLFNTIKDTAKAAETDVAAGKIAPGTSGSFELSIKNDSEVTAKYAIDYTVTNASNIPLKFSIDGGTTWTDTLADVAASASTTMTKGTSKPVTVDWKWDFSTSADQDTADTVLGNDAPEVTVKADLTVEQVD